MCHTDSAPEEHDKAHKELTRCKTANGRLSRTVAECNLRADESEKALVSTWEQAETEKALLVQGLSYLETRLGAQQELYDEVAVHTQV